MNQNRNQNRRRGRGSNRGGQGGGNQGNRIDSRARGNAPQLLEKYKKLAHDASLNGDRVQTEYYLQYADHYFRVVADSRTQRDDQRPRPDRERDQDREPSFDDGDDYEDQGDTINRAGGQREPRDRYEEVSPVEGERASEGDESDNPFTRDSREQRPRSRGRGRSANDARPVNGAAEGEPESGFDAAVLPPSIAREDEAAPRPRTRTRRPRPSEDDGEEALEAIR
ncbi:MAG TPA: DUF4167 domain-containing protein [Croceibacterium sp.]|nr:DUF4167 domain-containing protein [Croceibacterium sp.]